MSVLVHQLALVSESRQIPIGDVLKVATALQKQATRDIGPIWGVSATVDAAEKLEDVPPGYWPIIIMDDIGFDGAAGIHLDRDRQPFALVTASSDRDVWSLTASHELAEMIVDPFGDRLVAGDSPKSDQGRVRFLVEVSDPSEDATFGYSVNGILVSDFYTPNFFDPFVASGVRYSYTGAIKKPRQVLRGGYLSWVVSETNHWWQETWFDGAQASKFRDIGILDAAAGSFRSQLDRITGKETAKAIAPGRTSAKVAGLTAARVQDSSSALAAAWRGQIDALVKGQGKAPSKVGKPNTDRRGPKGFTPDE